MTHQNSPWHDAGQRKGMTMKDIHDNSIESHHEHESTGKGATYRKKIVALLTRMDIAMTDRQIIKTLQVEDFNNIRPEITRLRDAGVLEECGKIKCDYTGKTVRTVRIREFKEMLF